MLSLISAQKLIPIITFNVGWILIETRTELIGDNEALLIYRVGWPRSKGEPLRPEIIPEIKSPSFPEIYFSEN